MAMRDFQQYLNIVQTQILEMKADLADFEEALQAGYITEERLEEVKTEIDLMDANYQRLLYVDYLLSMPARKAKQARYHKQNKELEAAFHNMGADTPAVVSENKDALSRLRAQLKALKKNNLEE